MVQEQAVLPGSVDPLVARHLVGPLADNHVAAADVDLNRQAAQPHRDRVAVTQHAHPTLGIHPRLQPLDRHLDGREQSMGETWAGAPQSRLAKLSREKVMRAQPHERLVLQPCPPA